MSVEVNEDFEAVLVCAVRYSIGRQTYMPKVIVDFIRPLLPQLSNRTLSVLKRDVEDAGSSCRYGNRMIDSPVWVAFLVSIKDELNKRQ